MYNHFSKLINWPYRFRSIREEFQDVLENEIESNWDQVVDKCV